MPAYPTMQPSVYYLSLSIYLLYTYLLICPPTNQSTYLYTYLSTYQSIYISIYLPIYLYIYPCVCVYLSSFVSLQIHIGTSSFCLLHDFFFTFVTTFWQAIVPLQCLNLTRTTPTRTVAHTASGIWTRYFSVRLAEHSTALYILQGVETAFNFYCTWSNTL
jgi:hypothetical protein